MADDKPPNMDEAVNDQIEKSGAESSGIKSSGGWGAPSDGSSVGSGPTDDDVALWRRTAKIARIVDSDVSDNDDDDVTDLSATSTGSSNTFLPNVNAGFSSNNNSDFPSNSPFSG